MKLALALTCLVAVVVAQQRYKNPRIYVLDYVHNYRFEVHTNEDMRILVAISHAKSDYSCRIIDVDDNFDKYLIPASTREKVSEEIFNLIRSNQQTEVAVNSTELHSLYDDHYLLRECFRHYKYIMTYTPSFPLPTMAPGEILTTTA